RRRCCRPPTQRPRLPWPACRALTTAAAPWSECSRGPGRSHQAGPSRRWPSSPLAVLLGWRRHSPLAHRPRPPHRKTRSYSSYLYLLSELIMPGGASAGRSGAVGDIAVGDRHTPVATERARRDLHAWRRLAALVLAAIDQLDHASHGLRVVPAAMSSSGVRSSST